MLGKAVDYHGHRCPLDSDDEYVDGNPWARLREDPRLVALCQRIESDWEQQAGRLRASLALYDVDEVLAPVIAWAEKAAAKPAQDD